MIEPFISEVAFGIIVSLIGALGVYVVSSQAKRQEKEKKTASHKIAERIVREMWMSIPGVPLVTRVLREEQVEPRLPKELLEELANGIAERVAARRGINEAGIREKVHSDISELTDRLHALEARLSDEPPPDPESPFNDELFKHRIDQLADQLNDIEKKMLSKWDVAMIVAIILGGIAFVAGAVVSVFGLIGVI